MGHRPAQGARSTTVFGIDAADRRLAQGGSGRAGDVRRARPGDGRRADRRRRSRELPPESWIQVEKSILLQSLDHHWKEHLAMLDALRQVIHLRAYAQKKPIDEYKHEAFALFERMLASIREDVTRTLALRAPSRWSAAGACRTAGAAGLHHPPYRSVHRRRRHRRHRRRHRHDPVAAAAAADRAAGNAAGRRRRGRARQVSRNAPCPCGSGLKYKHCHGQLA